MHIHCLADLHNTLKNQEPNEVPCCHCRFAVLFLFCLCLLEMETRASRLDGTADWPLTLPFSTGPLPVDTVHTFNLTGIDQRVGSKKSQMRRLKMETIL